MLDFSINFLISRLTDIYLIGNRVSKQGPPNDSPLVYSLLVLVHLCLVSVFSICLDENGTTPSPYIP